jgi:hypothetical protein
MRSAVDLQAANNAIGAVFRRQATVAAIHRESVQLALELPYGDEDAQLKAVAVAGAVAQLGWLICEIRPSLLGLEMATAAALERA